TCSPTCRSPATSSACSTSARPTARRRAASATSWKTRCRRSLPTRRCALLSRGHATAKPSRSTRRAACSISTIRRDGERRPTPTGQLRLAHDVEAVLELAHVEAQTIERLPVLHHLAPGALRRGRGALHHLRTLLAHPLERELEEGAVRLVGRE